MTSFANRPMDAGGATSAGSREIRDLIETSNRLRARSLIAQAEADRVGVAFRNLLSRNVAACEPQP